MHINGWTLFFIIAAAQGWFLSFVLWIRKENRAVHRILAAFLLILALTLTEWVLRWSESLRYVPALAGVGFGFPLLHGPLLWCFYRARFQAPVSNGGMALHFVPFGIAVFFMLPVYLRFFEPLREVLRCVPSWHVHPAFITLMFVQMAGYGAWIAWRFGPFIRRQTEHRRWHRWVLGAYIGIILAYLLYRLFPWLGLTAPEWKYVIAFSLSFFIGLVAWLGYIQPEVFAGVPFSAAANPIKYRKSSLDAGGSAALFEQIRDLFEQECLYRDHRLSLDVLSIRLQASRHHVSQAINEQTGKTFAAWLTEYRIREARELLRATTKLEKNAIEIAYAVGFKSKQSFNAAFKKHTGQTPTEYRRSATGN